MRAKEVIGYTTCSDGCPFLLKVASKVCLREVCSQLVWGFRGWYYWRLKLGALGDMQLDCTVPGFPAPPYFRTRGNGEWIKWKDQGEGSNRDQAHEPFPRAFMT